MLEKVISGGQTGVDRAALDVAAALGVPTGGSCPRGRRAEDGRIPDRYPLTETASAHYRERTERNVLDSDGTLVLSRGPLSGGTALTVALARRAGRPCLVLDLCKPADSPEARPVEGPVEGPVERPVESEEVLGWLRRHRIRVLNVAGPRESQQPGIYQAARGTLEGIFQRAGLAEGSSAAVSEQSRRERGSPTR